MKVKVKQNQEKLNKWNIPNLKTGDILDVEQADDFAYLIIDKNFNRQFWLGIPIEWCEVVE